MTSRPHQLPPPYSSPRINNTSYGTPPVSGPMAPSRKMFVDSLLNHDEESHPTRPHRLLTIHPPTPPHTTHGGSPKNPTPRFDTPVSSSPAKPEKLAKDAAVFTKCEPKEPFNYKPFEYREDSAVLSDHDRAEMARHLAKYRVRTSDVDGQGRISDYTRRIPYCSDKKRFFGKTNRDAFETMNYVFSMPNDPKEYVVMWDYQVGLVRITSFFKALKYSKTTPAKALNSTLGLKELSHSITGGALIAQGYWTPFSCARALCLTFCYELRWVLTPIFGPEFASQCIRPDQKGFAKFNIPQYVVRAAQNEAEWQKAPAKPSPVPVRQGEHQYHGRETPRSIPPSAQPTVASDRWIGESLFTPGSPFDRPSVRRHTRSAAVRSPDISPKTPASVLANTLSAVPNWESINSIEDDVHKEVQSAQHADPPQLSLLTAPRATPNTSWRALEDPIPTTERPNKRLRNRTKSRRTLFDARPHQNDRDGAGLTSTRRSSTTRAQQEASTYSDSPGAESTRSTRSKAVQPSASTVLGKRRRRDETPVANGQDGTSSDAQPIERGLRRTAEYTEEHRLAAQILLDLHAADSRLARPL